jgi:hypothetical protein
MVKNKKNQQNAKKTGKTLTTCFLFDLFKNLCNISKEEFPVSSSITSIVGNGENSIFASLVQ